MDAYIRFLLRVSAAERCPHRLADLHGLALYEHGFLTHARIPNGHVVVHQRVASIGCFAVELVEFVFSFVFRIDPPMKASLQSGRAAVPPFPGGGFLV